MGEVVIVQSLQLCLAGSLFTDHDTFRCIRQGIPEHVRMRGADDLPPLGGLPKQVRKARQDVGMRPEFRFLDSDRLRNGRVAQRSEQAKIAESAIGQPNGGNRTLFSLRNTWTLPASTRT